MEYAIRLKGLTKSFQKEKVLKNITHDFEKGKIHGIMGFNGSGKTVQKDLMLNQMKLYVSYYIVN